MKHEKSNTMRCAMSSITSMLKILNLLRENARMPLKEIAEHVIFILPGSFRQN